MLGFFGALGIELCLHQLPLQVALHSVMESS